MLHTDIYFDRRREKGLEIISKTLIRSSKNIKLNLENELEKKLIKVLRSIIIDYLSINDNEYVLTKYLPYNTIIDNYTFLTGYDIVVSLPYHNNFQKSYIRIDYYTSTTKFFSQIPMLRNELEIPSFYQYKNLYNIYNKGIYQKREDQIFHKAHQTITVIGRYEKVNILPDFSQYYKKIMKNHDLGVKVCIDDMFNKNKEFVHYSTVNDFLKQQHLPLTTIDEQSNDELKQYENICRSTKGYSGEPRKIVLKSIDSLSEELKEYENKNNYLMVIYNVDIFVDFNFDRRVTNSYRIVFTIKVGEFVNEERFELFKECLAELDHLEEENKISIVSGQNYMPPIQTY